MLLHDSGSTLHKPRALALDAADPFPGRGPPPRPSLQTLQAHVNVCPRELGTTPTPEPVLEPEPEMCLQPQLLEPKPNDEEAFGSLWRRRCTVCPGALLNVRARTATAPTAPAPPKPAWTGHMPSALPLPRDSESNNPQRASWPVSRANTASGMTQGARQTASGQRTAWLSRNALVRPRVCSSEENEEEDANGDADGDGDGQKRTGDRRVRQKIGVFAGTGPIAAIVGALPVPAAFTMPKRHDAQPDVGADANNAVRGCVNAATGRVMAAHMSTPPAMTTAATAGAVGGSVAAVRDGARLERFDSPPASALSKHRTAATGPRPALPATPPDAAKHGVSTGGGGVVSANDAAVGDACYRRIEGIANDVMQRRVKKKEVWECMCRLLRPSDPVRDDLLRHIRQSWPGCNCTKLTQLATEAYARHALAVLSSWGMAPHVFQALDDTCALMKGLGEGGQWRKALRQRRTLGLQPAVCPAGAVDPAAAACAAQEDEEAADVDVGDGTDVKEPVEAGNVATVGSGAQESAPDATATGLRHDAAQTPDGRLVV